MDLRVHVHSPCRGITCHWSGPPLASAHFHVRRHTSAPMPVIVLPPKPTPKRLQPSSWLVGTWRSDKEKTIRRWDRGAPRPPDGDRRSFVETQLGKSVNRFTKARWYHLYDGSGFAMPYRVVWQNSNSLFVVYSANRHESGEVINFVSRFTYYVQRGGYVEFFTKDRAA